MSIGVCAFDVNRHVCDVERLMSVVCCVMWIGVCVMRDIDRCVRAYNDKIYCQTLHNPNPHPLPLLF